MKFFFLARSILSQKWPFVAILTLCCSLGFGWLSLSLLPPIFKFLSLQAPLLNHNVGSKGWCFSVTKCAAWGYYLKKRQKVLYLLK